MTEELKQLREALQSAQPAEVSDAEIRDALEAEFLNEPGKRNLADDLRIARAILALRPQAAIVGRTIGDGSGQAVIYDTTLPDSTPLYAGSNSQAVPMTDEQVDRIWNALPMGNGFWLSFARAVEAHHGITQPAKEQSK